MKNEYGMTPVITAAERTRENIIELFHSRENLLTKDEVNRCHNSIWIFEILLIFFFIII